MRLNFSVPLYRKMALCLICYMYAAKNICSNEKQNAIECVIQ